MGYVFCLLLLLSHDVYGGDHDRVPARPRAEAIAVREPLPPGLDRRVDALIAKLADREFKTRDDAMKALQALTSDPQVTTSVPVVDRLRKEQSENSNPEVQWRLRRALAVTHIFWPDVLACAQQKIDEQIAKLTSAFSKFRELHEGLEAKQLALPADKRMDRSDLFQESVRRFRPTEGCNVTRADFPDVEIRCGVFKGSGFYSYPPTGGPQYFQAKRAMLTPVNEDLAIGACFSPLQRSLYPELKAAKVPMAIEGRDSGGFQTHVFQVTFGSALQTPLRALAESVTTRPELLSAADAQSPIEREYWNHEPTQGFRVGQLWH